MNTAAAAAKPKDYASDQEVRWCPGCGDYAILKAMQKTLAEIGADRSKTVFISGIGCAARFPYYMSTYGFHTIHGRGPAICTGLKLANPELDIWLATGDGDSLSIGGNHLLHILRRNVDLQILLFNNQIYGLTKGQYSPTSRQGTRSPSSPEGSVDNPLSAGAFAMGTGARFYARVIDVDLKRMPPVLKRARTHRGTSLVEIFQNCIVYNDRVFSAFTDRGVAPEAQIHVEHGKPLIFGENENKGLRLNPSTVSLEVVELGSNGSSASDLLIHDETNRTIANLLIGMEPPAFPVALGVIYCDPAPTYEGLVQAQIDAVSRDAEADFGKLLAGGRTWEVD